MKVFHVESHRVLLQYVVNDLELLGGGEIVVLGDLAIVIPLLGTEFSDISLKLLLTVLESHQNGLHTAFMSQRTCRNTIFRVL